MAEGPRGIRVGASWNWLETLRLRPLATDPQSQSWHPNRPSRQCLCTRDPSQTPMACTGDPARSPPKVSMATAHSAHTHTGVQHAHSHTVHAHTHAHTRAPTCRQIEKCGPGRSRPLVPVLWKDLSVVSAKWPTWIPQHGSQDGPPLGQARPIYSHFAVKY